MKVLFDHNLSPKLARALNAFFEPDHEIVALRDKFSPSITDVDLIEALNQEGPWVFISGDRRITRNRVEKSIFSHSKVIGFFLAPSFCKAPEIKKIERLFAVWPTIEKQAGLVKPGAMFELPMKSHRLRQIAV